MVSMAISSDHKKALALKEKVDANEDMLNSCNTLSEILDNANDAQTNIHETIKNHFDPEHDTLMSIVNIKKVVGFANNKNNHLSNKSSGLKALVNHILVEAWLAKQDGEANKVSNPKNRALAATALSVSNNVVGLTKERAEKNHLLYTTVELFNVWKFYVLDVAFTQIDALLETFELDEDVGEPKCLLHVALRKMYTDGELNRAAFVKMQNVTIPVWNNAAHTESWKSLARGL